MQQGFSLLEVLIVLLIIGILSVSVYPTYIHHLTKARRSDAQTALFDLAQRMENYFDEHNTWEQASIGTGSDTDVLSRASSPSGWYNLSIQSATKTTYILQATPIGIQAKYDTQCQVLILNNFGQQDIDGNDTNNRAECWN